MPLQTPRPLPAALHLLGHLLVVRGVVSHSKWLGRTLGYPMANLTPTQPGQLLPGNGVYAAHARLADGRAVRAAVSVGTNPTTGADRGCKVGAFLMDGFVGDLYDQPFALDFREKVRDEQKFDGLDALVAQMGLDVARIAALPLEP